MITPANQVPTWEFKKQKTYANRPSNLQLIVHNKDQKDLAWLTSLQKQISTIPMVNVPQ